MIFAGGDTSNLWTFAQFGIVAHFGQAEATTLRLIRGESTFEEVVGETEDLFKDCDMGHTELQLALPEDDAARDLAVQWAIVSLKILLQIQHLRTIIDYKMKPNQEHFAHLAVVHELLTIRFMTFVKNGVVPIVA